jgi:uncharacterized protein (DUF2336 family)
MPYCRALLPTICGPFTNLHGLSLFSDPCGRAGCIARSVTILARTAFSPAGAHTVIAPPKILRLLARDDAIEVAAPVLTQAEELDIGTLIECARIKKQEQLLAISHRKTLPDKLIDVLVERGDQQVVLSTAENAGSRFSDKGFNTLIKRAHGDDALTSGVAMRSDLPAQLFD